MKITAGLVLLLALAAPHHCKRTKRWDESKGQNQEGWVRGTAGVDYPDYKEIPRTSFRCSQQPYEGMYADLEAQCQVYHVCHNGRKESFLCGPGTIFNQQIRACDYWYSFECDEAPNWYYLNAEVNVESPQPLQPLPGSGGGAAGGGGGAGGGGRPGPAYLPGGTGGAAGGGGGAPGAGGYPGAGGAGGYPGGFRFSRIRRGRFRPTRCWGVIQALELEDLALAVTLDLEAVGLALVATLLEEDTALGQDQALVGKAESRLVDFAALRDQAVTAALVALEAPGVREVLVVMVVPVAPKVLEAPGDLVVMVVQAAPVALEDLAVTVVRVVPAAPEVQADMVGRVLPLVLEDPEVPVVMAVQVVPVVPEVLVVTVARVVLVVLEVLAGTVVPVAPEALVGLGVLVVRKDQADLRDQVGLGGPGGAGGPGGPGGGSRPSAGGYGVVPTGPRPAPATYPGPSGADAYPGAGTGPGASGAGAQPGGGGAWQGPEYPSPTAGGTGGGGYYTSDSGAYSDGSGYPGQDGSGQLPGGAPQRPRGGGRGRRPQGGYGSPMMMGGAGGD
ncbi:hypothetical protein MTO96_013505 [Rhipicephalus appendiculatus]